MTHVVSVAEQPAATVTTIDDPTSVDTALTNALVSTVAATSIIGVSPYTIIDQSTGGGGGGGFGSALASGVSAGSSVLTMSDVPPLGFASRASVVTVGSGLTCEIRAISAVSGAQLTFDRALTNAHSASEPVIWYPGGVIPMGMWGAIGDNGVSGDDTTAVQAAIDQSAKAGVTANTIVWISGMGGRYRITRPLMFPDHTRVKAVGKFIATSATWGSQGAVAEATNALGMSCQNPPLAFTAAASTNVLTTPTVHGTAVGLKLTVYGASLPAPLIGGRVYFVKTAPSTTTLTLALTSGGAEIDLTTDGSGTVYSNINALERVYFDDVYFAGGAITNLNGFFAAPQQPFEWKKTRFDSFPGAAITIPAGQIGYFYTTEIVGCGKGVVLGASCSGMQFYGYNIDNTGSTGTAIESAGSRNCGVHGGWLEDVAIGVHLTTPLGYGLVLDSLQYSPGSDASPFVKVQMGAPNSGSFEIRGCRFNTPTQLVIEDVDRGFQILSGDLDASQSAMGIYSQPGGPVAPFISNHPVRAVTATATLNLADSTLLCNATSGAITVNLPTAVGIKGKRYFVKKTDASGNAVTLDGSASQTIDGATTKVLAAQYDSAQIESDGANWMVM